MSCEPTIEGGAVVSTPEVVAPAVAPAPAEPISGGKRRGRPRKHSPRRPLAHMQDELELHCEKRAPGGYFLTKACRLVRASSLGRRGRKKGSLNRSMSTRSRAYKKSHKRSRKSCKSKRSAGGLPIKCPHGKFMTKSPSCACRKKHNSRR
jgi:hypothetical protein